MNAQNREAMIEVCRVLAEQENLKVTITESAKGALFAAIGVFLGGVMAGPIGMAIGGSVTSIATAMAANGKFKSVVEILVEMNEDQKRRLSQAVQRAIQNVRPEDYVGLVAFVLSTPSLKEAVLLELGRFLRDEFRYQIVGL